MTRPLGRALLFLITVLFAIGISGCSDGDDGFVFTDSQGNTRQVISNDFVLQDNVRLLSPESGVEVAEIGADSLTLTGQVPPLQPGDVIIRGEGESQFTRRVVSLSQSGGQVTITTERVGLNDIFKEADIQETIFMGPEFLESLEPGIPGVTFGEPVQVLAQGTELQAFRLPINFNDAVIADNGRGSLVINGDAGIRVGLRTDLQVGLRNLIIPELRRFELTPLATIDGQLTVTGTGSGDFRKEIPLSLPLSYPLVGFGNLGLKLEGQFVAVVDGYVQSQGTLEIERTSVTFEGGVRYDNGSWQAVRNVTPNIPQPKPPALQAEAKINLSLMQPKVSLNLCDMGNVFISAQVLKLETEARLRSNPPEYDVRVYRTTGVELGAHMSIGIAPIVVRYDGVFPLVSGERTELVKLGVPIPSGAPNELFVTVQPAGGTDGPLKIGEEKVLFSLTWIQLQIGPALVPVPLPVATQWSSSNTNAVRLTQYGFVALARAVGQGSSDIKARSPGGREGFYRQAVDTSSLTAVEIVPGLSLGLGGVQGRAIEAQAVPNTTIPEFGSKSFRIMGTYANGQKADLTYSSSFTSSDGTTRSFRDGQVDGLIQGQTTLRASGLPGGRTASLPVTVAPLPIQSMHITPLSPSKLEVTSGQQFQLRASARFADGSVREMTRFVTWASTDPNIAGVDELGLVTPRNGGEVRISATEPDGNVVAFKKVVVNKAPVSRLRLRPDQSGPFLSGQTQQFKATAVFADGSSTSATGDVLWSCTDTNVATIDRNGVLKAVGAGKARVKASMAGVNATTEEFEVIGPIGFIYTDQPEDIGVGEEFSVELEVRDSRNQVWTAPLSVTLELSEGPTNAVLSGSLTATTSNGRAVFSGLTVDQAGPGYQLQAFASGLSIGLSDEFEALPNGGTGAAGFLFVNNRTSPGGVDAVNVLKVLPDGTFEQAPNSPYDSGEKAESLTRIGNTVVVANAGTGTLKNSLTSFTFDASTGTLTQADQTVADILGTSSPGILRLDSGGGDLVVSLATFDNLLKVFRVGNDGTLSQTDGENLVGSNFTELTYYDAPGFTTDYVYLSESGANRIRIFALDTVNGTVDELATGSPVANAFESPGAMETLGDRLFVLNPQANPGANEDDNMNAYNINPATGRLSSTGFIWGVGDGPVGIHAVGTFLYVGNQISADITAYRVSQASDFLTALNGGVPYPADEINPHSFADIVLSANLEALYVATSNRIAGFFRDTANGTLTTISGSPFSGFNSPGDLRR